MDIQNIADFLRNGINWNGLINLAVVYLLIIRGLPMVLDHLAERKRENEERLAKLVPPEILELADKAVEQAREFVEDGRRTFAKVLRTIDLVRGTDLDEYALRKIADEFDPDVDTTPAGVTASQATDLKKFSGLVDEVFGSDPYSLDGDADDDEEGPIYG